MAYRSILTMTPRERQGYVSELARKTTKLDSEIESLRKTIERAEAQLFGTKHTLNETR
jgi:hypothetical protein